MKFVKDTAEIVYCHYAFELTDKNYALFVNDMVEYINSDMSTAPDFVAIKAADFSKELLEAIWCGDEGDNVPEWVMKEYRVDDYYTHYSVYRGVKDYLNDIVFDHLAAKEYGESEDEDNFVEG